jgi:hypothetical protein
MKILKAKVPVFLNGRIIEPGSKFSCPDDQANKFIESKSAILYDQEKSESNIAGKKLESMTKDELLELAKEKGIEVSEKNKKDEIIALLSNEG